MPLMFQPLARYFDFQGRSRRSEYWLWFLFQIIVSTVFSILQATFKSSGTGALLMIMGIRFLYALAILIPNIAVGVRRLHDIGRTGWWLLFPTVIMLIAAVIYFSMNGGGHFLEDIQTLSSLSGKGTVPPAQALALMGSIMKPMLWILLPGILASIVTFVFHVTDGTPGPNRFGDDPKGRGSAHVF